MKNQRNRPQGYFLTILQEKDHYLVGKEKGLPTSSRRYLNFGVTLTEARKEAEDVKLLDGEHLWLGYQPKDNMPSVTEAWVQIYGKRVQYRSRRKGPYSEGFNWYGTHYESLFPFLDISDIYGLKRDRLGYNFTRDVIARKNLTVRQKKHLCSLCECNGAIHDNCRNLMNSEIIHFNRCDFSYMPNECEEHVKVSFPFGVICYKWGVSEKVAEYVKEKLW